MRYEKINDRKIAIKFINEKLKLSEVTRFFSPNIDTAAKVGIDNKNEITQLGQFWFYFAPNSLQVAEAIVSRYIDPCSALEVLNCSGFIWHPFISSILLLPAAPFLALLSFLFIQFSFDETHLKLDISLLDLSREV